MRNESRYHAESTLVDIVSLDDPNAGLGLLDRRSVLRARLRNLRDDAVRDLIVVAADGRLLALEFGEIGADDPLEPEAWPRREPRSPNWPDDVDLYVIHQTNMRMNKEYAELMGVPFEKVFSTVQDFGNTTGATIPIGLSEAVRQGRLEPGMLVLSCTFGSGLSWASALYRW